MDIREELRRRILVLDGGMGTSVQQSGILYDGNTDAMPMLHPGLIEGIHRSFIEAGADIVCTCSFGANSVSQQGYGLQGKVREMNLAAARVARAAASHFTDRTVWVMGSMGPTAKSLTVIELMADPEETLTRRGLTDAYLEQALALIDGGVDGFLVETVTDAENAAAALQGIREAQQAKGTSLPVMLSSTVMDKDGHLMTGSTLADLLERVREYDLLSVGVNCSFGAQDMYDVIKGLAAIAADRAVSVYPNAGLPTVDGYNEPPRMTADAVFRMASEGLINIAGGCCGTTPDHIRAVAEAVSGITPRQY